ncbi:MAG TPA: hypothetical protein VF174_08850 [Micromonosporaceae bacterium]
MSNFIEGQELRTLLLGRQVSKSTGTLAATTVALFTIAGGECLITSMYGKVTTAITVANSYKLQLNPTTGDTGDLCAATDIGTNDSAAGSLLTFALDTTTAPRKLIAGSASGGGYSAPLVAVVTTGQIEHVSAGTDGVITWFLTYVPLTTGATIVAA